MNQLKRIIIKLDFDEYMIPFLLLISIAYVYGVFQFLLLVINLSTFLIFLAYTLFYPILVYTVLKLFQGICRIIGVRQIMNSIKFRKK